MVTYHFHCDFLPSRAKMKAANCLGGRNVAFTVFSDGKRPPVKFIFKY